LDECPADALLCADGEDIVLRDALLPEAIAKPLADVVENCGAGRTSANPDLATW
jgi:hypothetical protein